MKPKEKLDGITQILFQSAMLTSNIKNPVNRALCDILIDHVPNLSYSTRDFMKSKEIYQEGKIGVLHEMDKLARLAEHLKQFNQKKIKPLPDHKKIRLDTIIIKGASIENLELVKSRVDIQPHYDYEILDIIDGFNKAMGTTLFNQITNKAIQEKGKFGLEITSYKKSNHQVKASLHFDSLRSVGVILNYTGRNVLGNSSRILITADVAVQPRFRVQYQKYLGHKKSWWWRSDLLG